MATGTLPKQVEIRKLVSAAARFEGEIPVSELSRVRAAVASGEGRVRYALRFERDEAGRSIVGGRIDGDVRLVCQRCLQEMTHALESDFLLGVVASDDLARQLPDHLEPLVAGEWLDLVTVVEDEVLLCLPIVSFHAEQDCAVSRPGYFSAEGPVEPPEARRPNPFEALSALKNK